MNLQRHWILHKDMWRVDVANWPECDGIIIGGLTYEAYASIRKRGRHFISCSGNYGPVDLPVVCLDDDATGAMAAEHLMERGLKHFGLYCPLSAQDYPLTGRPRLVYSRRARGFEQRLQAAGFGCFRSQMQPSDVSFLSHAHHTDLARWLVTLPKPIGILAVDDTYAHDLAEACREAQVSVPDSVAIMGINNDELLCESAWPPLSSVECSFDRMSYLAAQRLDRLMSGETLSEGERLTEFPPIRVQQRMSTDMLAIDQPDVAEAMRYIRDHACDPCTVDEIARVVPVSRRTLERQFVEHLGRSLHDEIARVRVETARRLLTQSDLPVEDVAVRCGFSTLSSFGRFFRKTAGFAPAAYRRHNRPRGGA
jgi:LacI family transcriptional regulator